MVKGCLGQLHGQGGGSLRGTFVLDQLLEGSSDTDPVYPSVRVETAVFTGKQGLNEDRGDFT